MSVIDENDETMTMSDYNSLSNSYHQKGKEEERQLAALQEQLVSLNFKNEASLKEIRHVKFSLAMCNKFNNLPRQSITLPEDKARTQEN